MVDKPSDVSTRLHLRERERERATCRPTKHLHNNDIVSVHFNHFIEQIFATPRRDLAMFTYIDRNVGES